MLRSYKPAKSILLYINRSFASTTAGMSHSPMFRFSAPPRRRTSTPHNLHPDFSLNAHKRPRAHRLSSTNSSPDLSERSSGESLIWSESSSDSEAPPLTPTTDVPSEDGGLGTREQLETTEVDLTKTDAQHASTTLLTQDASALQSQTGESDESGAQLIQKYCCGGGCCFLNKRPAPLSPSSIPLELPDNDAFRSLNLDLGPLHQESELTDLAPLPQRNVTLKSLPKSEDTGKLLVGEKPPQFVQPHPPYDVFAAPLYHARVLTKEGAQKKTFHFDIDITDYPEEGGVDFKVGGAVGVCPANYPEAVEEIFDILGVPKFLRDKPVLLTTQSGRWPTIWGEEQARELTTTRRQILTWCSDVQSYPPTKQLLRLLAEHATAPNEKKILLFLSSGQGQPAFCNLRTGSHLSISQLLHAFPSSKPPLDDLLSVLNQLMPRFYSLSNDPHVSSERDCLAGRRLIEVAVTIATRPNWKSSGHHHGVGSGFMERLAKRFIAAETAAKARGLSDREAQEEAQKLDIRVPMFRGLMANPLSKEFGESNGPMMLIGAGVGMAPFRGFILNRLRNANCASKIWLVQGVRDSSVDELYSGELGKYEAQIKKVVQSRARRRLDIAPKAHSEIDLGQLRIRAAEEQKWKAAQTESKYVQDEIRQQADIVWDIIRSVDGKVFVCGSSKGMGEGVEQALRDVAMEKGGFDAEGAARFWDEQKEVGKYITETW